MTKYIIHKSSRAPEAISYSGPTWDMAGIRNRYRPQYDNKQDALYWCFILTITNPVGFKVAEVEDEDSHLRSRDQPIRD